MKKSIFALVAATIIALGAMPAMAGGKESHTKPTAFGYADAGFGGSTVTYGDWSGADIYGESGSYITTRVTRERAHVHGGSAVEAGTSGYYEGADYGYSASELSLGGSGFGLAQSGKNKAVEGYRFSGDGMAMSTSEAFGDVTHVFGDTAVYGSGSGGFEVNSPNKGWNGSGSEAGMTASANGGAYASGTNHAAASSHTSAASSSAN